MELHIYYSNYQIPGFDILHHMLNTITAETGVDCMFPLAPQLHTQS